MKKVTRVFLETDLRCSHDGLIAIAEKEKVKRFEEGELLVFINGKRSMAKILSGKEAVLSLKPANGRIEVQALRYLPKYFGLKGNVAYGKALGDFLNKNLKWRKKNEEVASDD